jgi:hypothetical protein
MGSSASKEEQNRGEDNSEQYSAGSFLLQQFPDLRLTAAGALTASTRELCRLQRQLREWTQDKHGHLEPIVHIKFSHSDENGELLNTPTLKLNAASGGSKLLAEWPELADSSSASALQREQWVNERITQLLVFLDNINIQNQEHMRQHRRSLIKQFQRLSAVTTARLGK